MGDALRARLRVAHGTGVVPPEEGRVTPPSGQSINVSHHSLRNGAAVIGDNISNGAPRPFVKGVNVDGSPGEPRALQVSPWATPGPARPLRGADANAGGRETSMASRHSVPSSSLLRLSPSPPSPPCAAHLRYGVNGDPEGRRANCVGSDVGRDPCWRERSELSFSASQAPPPLMSWLTQSSREGSREGERDGVLEESQRGESQAPCALANTLSAVCREPSQGHRSLRGGALGRQTPSSTWASRSPPGSCTASPVMAAVEDGSASLPALTAETTTTASVSRGNTRVHTAASSPAVAAMCGGDGEIEGGTGGTAKVPCRHKERGARRGGEEEEEEKRKGRATTGFAVETTAPSDVAMASPSLCALVDAGPDAVAPPLDSLSLSSATAVEPEPCRRSGHALCGTPHHASKTLIFSEGQRVSLKPSASTSVAAILEVFYGSASRASRTPIPSPASSGPPQRSSPERSPTPSQQPQPRWHWEADPPHIPHTTASARGTGGCSARSSASVGAGSGGGGRGGTAGAAAAATPPSGGTPRAFPNRGSRRPVVPRHGSVFYPLGMEVVAPVQGHYLQLGGWRTIPGGHDAFSHRRLDRGEIIGHSVRWLHNARPRNRFVFLVDPVAEVAERVDAAAGEGDGGEGGGGGDDSGGGEGGDDTAPLRFAAWLTRKRKAATAKWCDAKRRVFGTAPAFAHDRGKLVKQSLLSSSLSLTEVAPDAGCINGQARDRTADWRHEEGPTPGNGEGGSVRRVSSSGSSVAYRSSPPPIPMAGDGVSSTHGGRSPTSSVGAEKSLRRRGGVEAVEIAHSSVTALDYSPRLTTSRLSIEAKEVRTYVFSSLQEALVHYGCPEALELMREQYYAGQSSRIPMPRRKREADAAEAPESSSSMDDDNSEGEGELERRGAESPSGVVAEPFNVTAALSTTSPTAEGAQWSASCHSSRDNGGGGGGRPTLHESPLSLLTAAQRHCHGCLPSDTHPRPLPPHRSHPPEKASGGGVVVLCDSPVPPALDCAGVCEGASVPVDRGLRGEDARRATSPSSLSDGLRTPFPSPMPPSPYRAVRPRLASSHFDTVVSVYTADPSFNAVLRELLMPEPEGEHPYTADLASQRRMLAMYETGMPAWTVFVASTILPYRRSLRQVYRVLVNLWPLISLFAGFYDLYRHLPQLKGFLAHTVDPVVRWVDERVTVRISFIATYLLSVLLTICASLSRFFGRFVAVDSLPLPLLRLLCQVLRIPLLLAFNTVWSVSSIALSFLRLLLMTVKVAVMAPFLAATRLSTISQIHSAAGRVPATVERASLTLRWWRAWQEFWVTVASPTQNLAKAWCTSVVYVFASAAKREASIRRWHAPKLRLATGWLHEGSGVLLVNAEIAFELFWRQGGSQLVVQAAVFACLHRFVFSSSQAILAELVLDIASGLWPYSRARRDVERAQASFLCGSLQDAAAASSYWFSRYCQNKGRGAVAAMEVPCSLTADARASSPVYAAFALLAPLLSGVTRLLSPALAALYGEADGRRDTVPPTPSAAEVHDTALPRPMWEHDDHTAAAAATASLTSAKKEYTPEALSRLQVSTIVDGPTTTLRWPLWRQLYFTYDGEWLRYDADELMYIELLLKRQPDVPRSWLEPGALRQLHRTAAVSLHPPTRSPD